MAKSLVDKILLEYIQTTPLRTVLSKYQPDIRSGSGSNLEVVDNLQNQRGLSLNVVPADFDKIPGIIKQLESEGWFCSFINVDYHEYGKTGPYYNYSEQNLKKAIGEAKENLSLEIEPNYDSEDEETRILIHLTPIENLKVIQSEGLKPLSRNTLASHPGRIYLMRPESEAMSMWFFAAQLFEKLKEVEQNLSGEYVALTVDLTNLPEVKLYDDPDYNEGLYTDVNIPKSVISVYAKKNILPILKKMEANGFS
jgi:hypothetical protein